MDEKVKSGKSRRDYILPASILAAALVIGVALIYNAGKGAGTPTATPPADNGQAQGQQPQGQGSLSNVKPVSAADHIFGDPNAPVKIVEFSDLECPFCKQFHQTMRSAMSLYEGKVAWIFRNFPLPQLHSKAPKEAQAAECAAKLGGNDKYWQYIDTIFQITPSNNGLDPNELPKVAQQIGLNVNDFNTCLSSTYGQDIIQEDEADGTNAGAAGTPYSIVQDANGLPQATVSLVQGLETQYEAQNPGFPPLFVISKDQKMFSVGGAAPYPTMKQIFDTLFSTQR